MLYSAPEMGSCSLAGLRLTTSTTCPQPSPVSAYVSIRQHTAATDNFYNLPPGVAYVSIRQHTSAYSPVMPTRKRVPNASPICRKFQRCPRVTRAGLLFFFPPSLNPPPLFFQPCPSVTRAGLLGYPLLRHEQQHLKVLLLAAAS